MCSRNIDIDIQFKVPSPLYTKGHVVKGTSPTHGGVPASVGHLYAFGNTEEKFRLKILGCKGRGRRRDGGFDRLRPQDRSGLGQGGEGGLLRRDCTQRFARCPHDHRNAGRHCSGLSVRPGETAFGPKVELRTFWSLSRHRDSIHADHAPRRRHSLHAVGPSGGFQGCRLARWHGAHDGAGSYGHDHP